MAKIKDIKVNHGYAPMMGLNAIEEYRKLIDAIDDMRDLIAGHREDIMRLEDALDELVARKKTVDNLFIVEYEEEEKKSINNECDTAIINRSDARYA